MDTSRPEMSLGARMQAPSSPEQERAPHTLAAMLAASLADLKGPSARFNPQEQAAAKAWNAGGTPQVDEATQFKYDPRVVGTGIYDFKEKFGDDWQDAYKRRQARLSAGIELGEGREDDEVERARELGLLAGGRRRRGRGQNRGLARALRSGGSL